MIFSGVLLSKLPPMPVASPTTASLSEPKSEKTSPSTSDSDSQREALPRKIKSSPQLNSWSRARAIRSGRKLDRPVQKTGTGINPNSNSNFNSLVGGYYSGSDGEDKGAFSVSSPSESDGRKGIEENENRLTEKCIYMVSDGTGWTAEHSVTAALGQFDYCLVDGVCPVNTHLFSGIDNVERMMEIIKQAAKEGAMVVYTLADPSMAEAVRQGCEIWAVPSADILSPLTEAIASHLGVSPSGLSRWADGRSSLGEEYFQRIEAIEFTIKQDDGALPENLWKADIILTGVSRTGKTPLSIYLAQKGYKVANVPIVSNVELPSSIFEVDPEKVFGLTINHGVLQAIRRARAKSLGFGEDVRSNYSEMDYVKEELEYASKIFAENPIWPIIEVTGKAIEETAAIVLTLYHDRKNKCSMPRISKRY